MGFDFIGEKGRRIRGLCTFAQSESLRYKSHCSEVGLNSLLYFCILGFLVGLEIKLTMIGTQTMESCVIITEKGRERGKGRGV
jgi:hypothetical protein